MARKSVHGEPKVQRGLSLPKPLYERISADAAMHGRSWNETVEAILTVAYSAAPDLQNPVEAKRISRADQSLEEAFA